MREIDATDRTIVNLRLEDSRRPYSDIAEQVGLSAPAVSDRVAKLQDLGIIQQFTLKLDQSPLMPDGVPVLVHLQPCPHLVEDAMSVLRDNTRIEKLFTTADGHIYFTAIIRPTEGSSVLLDGIEDGALAEYRVRLLAESTWNPRLTDSSFLHECTECGESVTDDELALVIDGDRYIFCCSACKSRFSERNGMIFT